MKKRMLAITCIFFFLLGLMPMKTLSVVDILFIAINDELPELTTETAPIRVGGITYVPCTVFDKRVTRVDLGVSYGWDSSAQKISLYSKTRVLEFDIQSGTAYDFAEDREYAQQAVVRNGIPYVPAAWSCGRFGMSCTFPITDDEQFQLLRIKNGNEVIVDDNMYKRSVHPILEDRAAKFGQGEPSKPTSGQSGGIKVDIPETSGENTSQEATVYFAIRVDGGAQLDSIFHALKRNLRVKGVFFFHNNQLASSDDFLRELVSNGHRVGLIAEGSSLEEQLRSLEEGNRLLEHILRQKASFVLNEKFSEDNQQGLQESGYLLWTANITMASRSRSDAVLYQSILDRIGEKKGKARVLLDDNTKGGTLSSVLRQLQEDQYEIRSIRETDY